MLLVAGCDQLFELGHVQPDAPLFLDAAPGCVGDTTLTTGLVAWYQMESIARDTLVDSSGNGHDGTCSIAIGTCPTPAPGKFCGGLHFDGLKQIVEIPSASDLEASPEFTVAAWLSVDQFPTHSLCPLNKLYGTTGDDAWQLCLEPDLSLGFFTVGSMLYSDSSQALTPNTWFHLAILYDGTNMVIAVNGLALTQLVAGPTMFDSQPVTIGADIDGALTTAPFIGTLDDVRIYNRALTTEEIAQLAAAGS